MEKIYLELRVKDPKQRCEVCKILKRWNAEWDETQQAWDVTDRCHIIRQRLELKFPQGSWSTEEDCQVYTL